MKPIKPFIVRKQYRARFRKLNEDVVRLYVEEGLTTTEIADKYDTSQSGVWKYLKRRGIDTSRKSAMKSIPCTFCGKEIPRLRNWIKRQRRHYCNQECYRSHLRDPRYTRKPAQTPNQRALDIMRELGI